ncbi:MAG: PhnD/SsuA/transferrin family substrate-binding protein [Methylococcaceae bacterium]|nr:PhnD/SsuA/transferrin family substrate-binding protein [Methylococcaceae bacterium]
MIKRLVFFQKFFFAILFCFASSNLVRAEQNVVTLAYLENGLKELKNNEKQIALQLLANELIRDSGVKMIVQPVRSFAEMRQLISDGKVDYTILNGYHLLEHYDFLQSFFVTPLLTIQRGPSDRENFIIVANKQYIGQELINLQGKTLSLHPQYLLMKFYLEYLIENSSGLDILHFFSKIKYTKTASQAVLDVYFGSSDLCIIPKHIFDLTVELNPAIMQKIFIMHQSGKQFFPVLILNFKHVDNTIRTLINKNLSLLNQTARGQQILDMFSIQSVHTVKLKKLHPMQNIFKHYQSLLKK